MENVGWRRRLWWWWDDWNTYNCTSAATFSTRFSTPFFNNREWVQAILPPTTTRSLYMLKVYFSQTFHMEYKVQRTVLAKISQEYFTISRSLSSQYVQLTLAIPIHTQKQTHHHYQDKILLFLAWSTLLSFFSYTSFLFTH